jgi:preprotein translocase subunit SecA
MEAFMEEVVGFVFHLDVQVEQRPTVGVVVGADGRGVRVDGQRNGSRPDAPLIESGPDPDGPGVEAHAVGETTLDEEELIDLIDGEPLDHEPEPEPVSADPVPTSRPQVRAKGLDSSGPRTLAYTAPEEDGTVKTSAKTETRDDPFAGTPRNAACPCGSGKKFKMCHGRPGAL